MSRFPLPIPAGWFVVAESEELRPGEVRPLTVFGAERVLYRTEAGHAALLDAHCPHLGAHLGHGGKVEGDGLRCPFHGWAFATSGLCTSVPYARRIPRHTPLRAWRIKEAAGRLWAWHAREGRAPDFDPPRLEEADSPAWRTLTTHAWTIRSCLQELAENGSDSAHFRFVHDMRAVPRMDTRFDGPLIRSSTDTVFPRKQGAPVPGRIDVESTGLGCDVMRYRSEGQTHLVEIVSTTPIDSETVAVRMAYLVRGDAARGEVEAMETMAQWLVWQFEKDIPIWENKCYRPNPPLCDGDGPIGAFRRWCRQFD